MAVNFIPGQVAVSDPNPGGPSAISNTKDVQVKAVKITSANFGTSAVNTLVAVLPADASLLFLTYNVKTQLAGGGITAATGTIGFSSGTSEIVPSFNFFGTNGNHGLVTPNFAGVNSLTLPLPNDRQIWFSGTSTTGNPTSGEIHILIFYVR